MTEERLLEIIKLYYLEAGSLRKAAVRLGGITPQYLNDILHGRRVAGEKVLNSIRLRRITTIVDK